MIKFQGKQIDAKSIAEISLSLVFVQFIVYFVVHAIVNFGFAFSVTAGLDALARGDHSQAVNSLGSAETLSGGSVVIHEALAITSFAGEGMAGAEDRLSKIERLLPQAAITDLDKRRHVSLNVSRGLFYMSEGIRDEAQFESNIALAEENFQRALSSDPAGADANIGLAWISYLKFENDRSFEDRQKFAEYIERAFETSKINSGARTTLALGYNLRGLSLMQKNDGSFYEAFVSFQGATQYRAAYFDPYVNREIALAELFYRLSRRQGTFLPEYDPSHYLELMGGDIVKIARLISKRPGAEAEEQYVKSLSRARAMLLNAYGLYMSRLGGDSKSAAILAFEKASELYPEWPLPMLNAYLCAGKWYSASRETTDGQMVQMGYRKLQTKFPSYIDQIASSDPEQLFRMLEVRLASVEAVHPAIRSEDLRTYYQQFVDLKKFLDAHPELAEQNGRKFRYDYIERIMTLQTQVHPWLTSSVQRTVEFQISVGETLVNPVVRVGAEGGDAAIDLIKLHIEMIDTLVRNASEFPQEEEEGSLNILLSNLFQYWGRPETGPRTALHGKTPAGEKSLALVLLESCENALRHMQRNQQADMVATYRAEVQNEIDRQNRRGG
ncbi:MAG: hypothetical protein NUW37_10305 [Planctomycetes bacterium]|nr:hypothetical protein [Planctomycetota bacterium]